MKCSLGVIFSMLFFIVTREPAMAQDARLKIGVGANYISNNYDEQYLNDFGSYSLNTSYTLLQQKKYAVVWEQNTLLRHRDNDQVKKRAFIFSAPVSFRFQPSYKTGVYLGFGPTYLSQRYEDYSIAQRVRVWHATVQAGVAFKSRPFAEALFAEYHVKAGVHRSINNNGNMAPFLTVAVQLGANQRAARHTKG